MLKLNIASDNDTIVVTFTELTTITNPWYLLVFKNISTNDEIVVLLNSYEDQSDYPDRYNQFTIDTASLFTVDGQYLYTAYEAENGDSTHYAGLNMVEQGRADIIKQGEVFGTNYEPVNNYKVYAG